MTIATPLGLLGLLAVPVLVGLYLLRRRSAPRRVSALFLWRSTNDTREAGPHVERLRRELSLALELVAVLAATALLAGIRWGGVSGEHVVVVLDGSLSMSARGVLEPARSLARERVGEGATCTVLETGERPRVLAGPAGTTDSCESALDRWRPVKPTHAAAATLALAKELAAGASVLFVTDAKPEAPPGEGIELVALGRAQSNAGIVAATRTDEGTKASVLLRVANFSKDAAALPVELSSPDEGRVLATQQVSLGPGESVSVKLEASGAGRLRVKLPSDALPVDDVVDLLPANRRPVRLRVDDVAPAVRDAVARFVAASSDVVVEAPADLVIAAKAAGPWSLRVGVEGAADRTWVGPFFGERQHPLLEDVRLDGVVWSAGPNPPGRPLVTTGDRVLVSEAEGPVFHLNVDLARSSLSRALAWPVLLGNLVELRRSELPGAVPANVPAGESVTLHADASARWSVKSDAFARVLQPGANTLEALEPGLHAVSRDDEVVARFSVLALDAGESDLRTRSAGVIGTRKLGASDEESSTFPRILLLVVLAALLVDWLVAVPGVRRWGRARA